LILPSNSHICLKALKNVKYIGCSTEEDWDHVKKHNVVDNAVQISHSINLKNSLGLSGFKDKFSIKTDKMFLSSGGFWQHKGMEELHSLFSRLPLKDTTLVFTGYQNPHLKLKETENIRVLLLEDRQDVLNAIKECDLYILNSYQEGFGLVLLESMYNNTPWIARNIAGAKLMKNYGDTYEEPKELMKYLINFNRDDKKIKNSYDYLINNHTIDITVKQIVGVLNE
jgi:glycosyltransferase involved in cell wall biosynthesis